MHRSPRQIGGAAVALALIVSAWSASAVAAPPHAQAAKPAATTTSSPDPSGVPKPVGGNATWHQEFSDDFVTPTTTFPGPYAKKWTAYNNAADTSGNGVYSKSAISAANGMLQLHLHFVNGKPQVAAPLPLLKENGKRSGQKYGTFAVRFKASSLAGYKTAWLLWPDSNNAADGEIDFPEGRLSEHIEAFDHVLGANHHENAMSVITSTTFTSWHTAVIVWIPSGVFYYLDGKEIGHCSVSPKVSMHWVLQTETATNGYVPTASQNGYVDIDWVSIYTLNPTKKSSAAAAGPASLVLNRAPTYSKAPSTVHAKVGHSLQRSITTVGSPTPQLTAHGVPKGLQFRDTGNGVGVLSGTATRPGRYHVVVVAKNSAGTKHHAVRVVVDERPRFVSPAVARLRLDRPNHFVVRTRAYPNAHVSAHGLPPGLHLRALRGGKAMLYGAPSRTGVFHVMLRAHNGSGRPRVQRMRLRVR